MRSKDLATPFLLVADNRFRPEPREVAVEEVKKMSEPEKRTNSADIKKQIEEATKAQKETKIRTDLKDSGLPLVGGVASEINALGSTTETKPITESKTEPALAPAQPASEKATANGSSSVDLQEWAKKKGVDYTSDETTLAYLRKRDQEFHKQAAERRKMEEQRPPVAPAWTPPSPYQQPNVNGYPPSYGQPNQRQLVEQMARNYNMTPEDFERVAQLNRDMMEVTLAQERKRHSDEMERMKMENVKNSEFRELSADPVFRKPEVAMEFHNVLEQMQESDPQSFGQDPYAYRRAYDKALANIGRRNLEGNGFAAASSPFQLPSNPPKPAGQGSGGGRQENEGTISGKEFAALSEQDKRALLSKMGLVQSKY